MAALTADRLAMKRVRPEPIKVVRPVVNGEVIYANSLVGVRSDTGLVEAMQDTAGAYSHVEVLVSTQQITGDGTTGYAFLRNIVMEFNTDFTAATAHNGDTVYGADDQTVTDTAGTKTAVGTVNEVLSTSRVMLFVA